MTKENKEMCGLAFASLAFGLIGAGLYLFGGICEAAGIWWLVSSVMFAHKIK